MSAAVIPSAILPRVAQLLRLIGSPVDGEVLAACRALGRTLAGAGADFHTLADAVERPARRSCCRSREAVRPWWDGWSRHGSVALSPEQCRSMSAALRRGLARGRLTEWETGFARSIVDRFSAGRGRLSEKQGDALRRLLEKLGEGNAWA